LPGGYPAIAGGGGGTSGQTGLLGSGPDIGTGSAGFTGNQAGTVGTTTTAPQGPLTNNAGAVTYSGNPYTNSGIGTGGTGSTAGVSGTGVGAGGGAAAGAAAGAAPGSGVGSATSGSGTGANPTGFGGTFP
jgi:hypothetical protein